MSPLPRRECESRDGSRGAIFGKYLAFGYDWLPSSRQTRLRRAKDGHSISRRACEFDGGECEKPKPGVTKPGLRSSEGHLMSLMTDKTKSLPIRDTQSERRLRSRRSVCINRPNHTFYFTCLLVLFDCHLPVGRQEHCGGIPLSVLGSDTSLSDRGEKQKEKIAHAMAGDA